MIVDPRRRTFSVHDRETVTAFAGANDVRHDALPGFRSRVDRFFEAALFA